MILSRGGFQVFLPVPWGSFYRAELWEIYALLIKQL